MTAYEKVMLVTRKTRLAELIERFNTRGQAKFYIEHSGGDFGDYEREDQAYREALETLRRALRVGLKVHAFDRALVPTLSFAQTDIVVTLGQDGLVANCAKYIGEQPLIAVNPDPSRFDGALLPFTPEQARSALLALLGGRARVREVALAQAQLNDGRRLLAFNDLFIGPRSHVSARYRIRAGGREERQSSSGVIVSTGAGSTGWLSSVFNMASGVARFSGAKPLSGLSWPWEQRRLAYVVREPFVSLHSSAGLVAGVVADAEQLIIESLMPSGGVIFSDGVEADFLEFNAGATARIGVAQSRARLVAA